MKSLGGMTGEEEDVDVVGMEVQVEEKRDPVKMGRQSRPPGRRGLGGGAWGWGLGGGAWEAEQMRGTWILLKVGQRGTMESGFYFIFEAKKSFTNS